MVTIGTNETQIKKEKGGTDRGRTALMLWCRPRVRVYCHERHKQQEEEEEEAGESPAARGLARTLPPPHAASPASALCRTQPSLSPPRAGWDTQPTAPLHLALLARRGSTLPQKTAPSLRARGRLRRGLLQPPSHAGTPSAAESLEHRALFLPCQVSASQY